MDIADLFDFLAVAKDDIFANHSYLAASSPYASHANQLVNGQAPHEVYNNAATCVSVLRFNSFNSTGRFDISVAIARNYPGHLNDFGW